MRFDVSGSRPRVGGPWAHGAPRSSGRVAAISMSRPFENPDRRSTRCAACSSPVPGSAPYRTRSAASHTRTDAGHLRPLVDDALPSFHRQVGRAGVVGSILETVPIEREVRDVFAFAHVCPRLARLHEPVVGPGPNHALLQGRFRDRKKNGGVCGSSVVQREPPRALLFGFVVRREIRAQHGPALATVRRHVDVLATHVDALVIVRPMWIGKVHWKRYRSSPAAHPSALAGHTLTLRASPNR